MLEISLETLSKYFDEIKTQFESSFQGKDGNVTYSATLVRDDSEENFYFDFVDQVVDKNGKIQEDVGRVTDVGDTKKIEYKC